MINMKQILLIAVILLAGCKKDKEGDLYKGVPVDCSRITTTGDSTKTPVIHGIYGLRIKGNIQRHWIFEGTVLSDNGKGVKYEMRIDGKANPISAGLTIWPEDTTHTSLGIRYKIKASVADYTFFAWKIINYNIMGTQFILGEGETRELSSYCNCEQFK